VALGVGTTALGSARQISATRLIERLFERLAEEPFGVSHIRRSQYKKGQSIVGRGPRPGGRHDQL